MKHLFIVNPTAGGRDSSTRIRALVDEAFRNREDDYEVYVAGAVQDSPRKIRREAEKAEQLRVYACGGDGTFNQCVCGAAGLSNVALCPFPTGTGNDFCRMFGEEKALFQDLDALLAGSIRPMDLIDCNGRLGANICSAGIDARVGVDVHKYSHVPLLGKKLGYVLSLLVNVLQGTRQEMHIRCGDYEASGEHTLVCACNGRYYGGGFHPSLDARPDDGELDIYIVKGVGLLRLARYIGAFSSGNSDKVPDYIHHLHGTEIALHFEHNTVLQVDGEAMYAKDVVMKVLPGAMNLIVPKGMKFFES